MIANVSFYSEEAKDTIFRARIIARALGCETVRADHLLLGLHGSSCRAVQLLHRAGFNPPGVAGLLAQNKNPVNNTDVTAATVISNSYEEILKRSHDQVLNLHMLYAMLLPNAVPDTAITQMLMIHGVDVDKLRRSADIALKLVPIGRFHPPSVDQPGHSVRVGSTADTTAPQSKQQSALNTTLVRGEREGLSGWMADDAKSLVAAAVSTATTSGASNVGVDHLLRTILHSQCSAQELLAQSMSDTDLQRCLSFSQSCPDRSGAGQDQLFTPEASAVLQGAWEEARRRGLDFINSEHILVAMLRQSMFGETDNFLGRCFSQPSEIKTKVIYLLQNRESKFELPKVVPSLMTEVRTLHLSRRACQILEYARSEAMEMNQREVNLVHLLLGLILESGNFDLISIRSRGIDFEILRERLCEYCCEITHPTYTPEDEGQFRITFATSARSVIAQAAQEAQDLKFNFVDLNHIGLAILALADETIQDLLQRYGINLLYARRRLRWCSMWSKSQADYQCQVTCLMELSELDEYFEQVQQCPKLETGIRLGHRMRTLMDKARIETCQANEGKTCIKQLLLGIFAKDSELRNAADILSDLGLTESYVREALDTTWSPVRKSASPALSSRAMKLLDHAWLIVQQRGGWSMQPEHLLLALADESERWAALVCESLNIDVNELRERTLAELDKQGKAS